MKKITLLFLFLFAALAVQLQAQSSLSFQGVLKKNSTGAAVEDGNYDLTFQLYESASAGSAIWGETQVGVTVVGGVYSTLLGEVVPLNLPFDKTYYLGVAVDGAAELIPRIQLTAAPYALSLVGTSNVFSSNGDVGVGTLTPTAKLHVVGDVKIDGNLETTGGLGIAFDSLTVDVNTTGNMKITPDSLHVPGADEQLRILRGYIVQTGATFKGTGFTSSKLQTGEYRIDFDEPFSDTPAIVVGSTQYFYNCGVVSISTDHFIVKSHDTTKTTPTLVDQGIFFIAIGPR